MDEEHSQYLLVIFLMRLWQLVCLLGGLLCKQFIRETLHDDVTSIKF